MPRFVRHAKVALGLVTSALAVLAIGVLVIIPWATRSPALNVLSGSMEPTYPVGSVVVVRPVAADAVTVGDVVTFVTPDSATPTTHRVAEITTGERGERTFITKGDANPGVDADPVPAADIRGVVWFHVPFLGTLRDRLASPSGMGVLAVIILMTGSYDHVAAWWRGRRGHDGEAELASQDDRSSGPPEGIESPDTGSGAQDPPFELVPNPAVALDDVPPQALLVVRLNCSFLGRAEILALVAAFHGRTVAVGRDEAVVTFSGSSEELDGIEKLLLPSYVTSLRRSDEVPTYSLPRQAPTEPVSVPPVPVHVDRPVVVAR